MAPPWLLTFPLKHLMALIFFMAGAGYVIYQFSGLVHKLQLIIDYPADGGGLATELVTIRGRADGAAKLTANDEPLTLDENGAFETKLLLAPGYNIIRFSGTDRFGRIVEKKLQLTYQTHD